MNFFRILFFFLFKATRSIIEEELQKKPCFKHFVSSNCLFQSQCRCSHKSLDELEELIGNYELGNLLFFLKLKV
jgi:hypothetical protein